MNHDGTLECLVRQPAMTFLAKLLIQISVQDLIIRLHVFVARLEQRCLVLGSRKGILFKYLYI